MSTLTDLLDDATELAEDAVEHLQRLVSEWQLICDLSFADLSLWVPRMAGPEEFLCVAQARPTTAPTSYPHDMVGESLPVSAHRQLRTAIDEQRICREEDPQWDRGMPVRREAIPIRHGGAIVAVLARETNLSTPRVPSQLEITYLGCAGDLCQMITDGSFPPVLPSSDVHTSPRVGDGLIRLDPWGVVVFASPNALSAYHRMGHAAELTGTQLADLTKDLIADPLDGMDALGRFSTALRGGWTTRFEVETSRGSVALFRTLPLSPNGNPAGVLVLVRDVTEVKRRDRALLSKDATISEIHHRVKNNLQTVAALLRLQSRRVGSAEARAALGESVRRVASIAMVHEMLAGSVDERVDMDEILARMLPMLGEVTAPESRVALRSVGRFGVLRAELATALMLVLAELVQNAYEHAYPAARAGVVEVVARRSSQWLDVLVLDEGVGLPAEFALERTDRLGLQIVRTLVGSELRGTLSLRNRDGRGAEATLRIPLRPGR
ncbi:MAG: sensor histidine kinase [Sciscionella sp.]